MRTAVVAAVSGLILVGCSGQTVPSSIAPRSAAAPTLPASSESRTLTASVSPSPTLPAAGAATLSSQALRAAIGAPAIRAHLDELQRVADENGGNRADGTPGFDASMEYVERRLTEAGFEPERQAFTYDGQTSANLIAELPGRDGAQIVMIGAHLDSVPAGPGINDDGSGVATVLALAEQLAQLEEPEWTVRFAFWGAEEPGLKGSIAYVDALDLEERERLAAYINLEMLGSPNYIRFVHSEPGAPTGSDAISSLLTLYFDGAGLAWDPIDLTGKADHTSFSNVGIPTGGLFGGGREPKTDDQAARFGGTAGEPADPCSDVACDAIANINDVALEEMSDAVAHVVATLAGE